MNDNYIEGKLANTVQSEYGALITLPNNTHSK